MTRLLAGRKTGPRVEQVPFAPIADRALDSYSTMDAALGGPLRTHLSRLSNIE
jgi:hypothetical protein